MFRQACLIVDLTQKYCNTEYVICMNHLYLSTYCGLNAKKRRFNHKGMTLIWVSNKL